MLTVVLFNIAFKVGLCKNELRLIASKIKVCVCIIYLCVLYIIILYI